MISISPPTAFLLYLALALAAILYLWISHEARARRRRVIPPEFLPIRCEYCTHAYFSSADRAVARCPCCDCLSKS